MLPENLGDSANAAVSFSYIIRDSKSNIANFLLLDVDKRDSILKDNTATIHPNYANRGMRLNVIRILPSTVDTTVCTVQSI